MQNEKELFNMMKKAYPQSPSKEFIVSTENNLKQRARKIDGTDYAKIMFVVSKTSVNYEENKSFAIRIHKKLEQMYPGLSRGVIEKGVDPKNTYNQDIQNQSLLLDIGGVENTLEESYRSTEALAKAIAEIIRETNE